MPEVVLFSAPKPFTNSHIGLIQRNAIRSWKALGASVEVILLGDEDGLAQTAKEIGVKHIPEIQKAPSGAPLISSMLEQVKEATSANIFVIINSDIIVLPGFIESILNVDRISRKYLIMGHRWDMEINEVLDFLPGWADALKNMIKVTGKLHKSKGSDYFVFRRDQFDPYPPFVIGRAGWDNWTIFTARKLQWDVIDATRDIQIIHQQHDYHHLPGGKIHYNHPESDENLRLAGGKRHIFTLLDATKVLVNGRIQPYPVTLRKIIREFEVLPVIHGGNPFWMDVFFYLAHPIKFIRHKIPWLANMLRISRNQEMEEL